jgi:hypothetical protein
MSNHRSFRFASPQSAARPWLLIGIAALFVAAAPPSSRSRGLSDFALLKRAMEGDYANLAWFASPQGGVDLPRLVRKTEAALAAATTDEEARAAIKAFVEALGDGHFSILPAPADPRPGGAEPDSRDLAGAEAGEACAALGYANRSQVAFSLPFESLAGFTLIADGQKDSFRSGILEAGATRIGLVRIRNFSPSQFPAECESAWRTASAAERSDKSGFADRVQERWLRSLADAIARIRSERPDVLIVDVGTNSGGNDSGDWAARLFTDRPIRSSRMLVSSGSLATRYLDEELAALREAISKSSDPASVKAGEYALATLLHRRQGAANGCAMGWAWTERRTWQPHACARLADAGFASGIVDFQARRAIADERIARRIYWPAIADDLRGTWTGRTYVLTNSTTYSSAEMFAATLRNNGAAKVAGSHSGGDGCGFAVEAKPLALPALNMRIRMPNCVRLRADGSDEVAGIEPDLPVLGREGESQRGRAARLIAAVTKDLAGPN